MKLFLHVHTKDQNYKPILLRARDAYDPSEARDPGGKWTSGGGKASTKTETKSSDPLADRFKSVAGVKIKWTKSGKANAELAAQALSSSGFRAFTKNPSGAKTNPKFAAIGSPTNGVLVNPACPYWKDPEGQAKFNFEKGWLSTDHPLGVLIHEAAHTIYDPPNTWMADQQKAVATKVSKYAAVNPKEFVSEVTAGLHTGKKYDEDVMRLYQINTTRKHGQDASFYDAWEEEKHPRGHPGNPGQFVSKGQGGSTTKASPQESPPQERATSEGKTRQPKAPEMPPELKPHATQYPDNYWTFEPSGDRYMSQHFNLETPGGSASLVLSKESPDWHLFLLDAPIGKENIFGQGQTALEKELIKQGMLSGPSPKKITLPKNVKVTAKAPTKATFSGSDKQENATGYAIDDEVTGRKYVIVSDESDSWKISRPGQTIGRHGRGQESLNDALSSFARKKEIPKPETGSRQDQAASELSKIRVEEAVSRYHKSSFSKPDKEQMYRDIGQAVFDYMGIDKSVGFRVGEPYEFKVGDKIFRSGGHFDPRVNAVSVFTNNEPELVDKLIAHESMHAKFDAVGRAYRKETNQLGKLDYEQYEKVLKPDGSVRDEYKDQYPLHAAMPMGFGLLQGSSRDKLQEDDGCTDYSRAYWEAVKTHPGEARSDPLLAINETLAEMSMLDREGSLPRMLWYKNSKTYKPLYKLIHDQYPHAVEYLKD